MIGIFALLVCLPAAAQQSSRSADYTYDVNGRRVEGLRTTRSDGSTAQWMRNQNGREAPLEKVQERVISQGPEGKVVERTIQPFDNDGRAMPPRRIRIEERVNPDGSATTLTTEHHADMNGHMEVWQRATTSTRKSGDRERSETVVERPGPDGGLEIAEKREATVRKSGATSQEDAVIYRKDPNGRFIPSERKTTERTEAGGEVIENRAEYARGSAGLEFTERTVSRTRKGAGGAEVKEVDVFRPQVPGMANDTGRPQLRERQLIETRIEPGGGKVETLSVSRPSTSDPKKLSAWQKISERVCQGDCTN